MTRIDPAYRGGSGVQSDGLAYKKQAPVGGIVEAAQLWMDERACRQVWADPYAEMIRLEREMIEGIRYV